MSEENKAIVGRWFTEFWGNPWNPAVVDELAAPDIRFEYSMHAPRRGREDVKKFATEFLATFPDLNLWGTADLIAEGDYVVHSKPRVPFSPEWPSNSINLSS